jgi:hypothetical protein
MSTASNALDWIKLGAVVAAVAFGAYVTYKGSKAVSKVLENPLRAMSAGIDAITGADPIYQRMYEQSERQKDPPDTSAWDRVLSGEDWVGA